MASNGSILDNPEILKSTRSQTQSEEYAEENKNMNGLFSAFGSNFFQICFCFISGLMCFLPLFLKTPSNLEMKALHNSLSESSGFTICCASSIALVVPLFLDLLLDLATSRVQIIKQKFAATGAIRFTFLNIPERILILIGMTVVPVVAFLPKNTDNLGLIYLCCDNCQQNLVGGTVLLSLSRYDKNYWSPRSTWLSLLFYCSGLVVGTFISNTYAGESTPSQSIVALDFLTYIFVLAPCLMFLINSFRWLIVVYCKVNSWKGFLYCSYRVQPLTKSQVISSNTPDHKFFPMIYTACGVCTVLSLSVLVGISPRLEDYDTISLYQNSAPYLCFLVLISTMSMRMVKFEVVQGLYALIDSKKSYVRYISHELRTPLNSAFLGLKLLTDGLQSSRNPKDLEKMEILVDVNVACRTTLDILNDLLCFDKMESGMLVAHKHEVHVYSFISDCVSMFSAQAREANVTVKFSNCGEEFSSSPGSSPLMDDDTVLIDRFKMDQVLRNLISNALKFTPRGGSVVVHAKFFHESSGLHLPQIVPPKTRHPDFSSVDQSTILRGGKRALATGRIFSKTLGSPTRISSTTNLYENPIISASGRLIITVKDSGSGMLEKDYIRLFKEIVQFNPEVLQAGGGSGLGLWITKGIVDLHQGEISVHSEGLGCGSSFTVELPMERVLLTTDESNPHGSTLLTTLRSAGGIPLLPLPGQSVYSYSEESKNRLEIDESAEPVYHLLIVDDSPLNRKMLQRTFRAAGHICDEAEDGVIAVTKVKEMMESESKAYSAILMDFVMPNMDGPTATKEIRSLGYTAPIFGVTGNTLDTDINYFIVSGANKVLAKPFDMEVFNKAILGIEQ